MQNSRDMDKNLATEIPRVGPHFDKILLPANFKEIYISTSFWHYLSNSIVLSLVSVPVSYTHLTLPTIYSV